MKTLTADRLKELASQSNDNFVTFVNSRGISMKLRAVPPYLVQMIYESMEKPQPPTYTVSLEGGGEEVHVHDETSIAQSPEADKLLWDEYKSKLREIEIKLNEAVMNVILMEGVEVGLDQFERVRGRFKIFGLPVPEDPVELELAFKRTYVLGTPEDAENISTMVMTLTGISQEDLNAVKKSFQS